MRAPLVKQQLKAECAQKRRPEQAAVPEDSSVRGPSIDRVRTVYLPTNNAETLLLRMESLLAQLHDTFMNECVAALMEDRRIREQEEESRAARDKDIIKELSDKLSKREDVLQQTTKGVTAIRVTNTRLYVALKRDVAKELQERTEACERLSTECDALRASNEQLQMEHKALESIQVVEHIREYIKKRVELKSSSTESSGEQKQLRLAELESDIELATHALKETMHKEHKSRISASEQEIHRRDVHIRERQLLYINTRSGHLSWSRN
eukprot:jgi/Chlat1/8545/Chrsp82S07975